MHFFLIFPVHGENNLGWPQMGPSRSFLANPDLADILGRTDLDFDNFDFFDLWITNFWISRFPDCQNLALAKLGPSWAGLGPSGPTNVDFLL